MQDRILVVDDDPNINKLIAQILRRQGYDVMQVHDGAQALEAVQAFAPDLILSDIEMPNMDGLTFVQELQKEAAMATLPVIFVTGRGEIESRVQGLEYSVDYITKPFAPPELLARVKKALRARHLEQNLRTANEETTHINRHLLCANEQLEQLAVTDELTRISNRRGFEKSLTDELYRMRRLGTTLALVLFDIDHFKRVNDTWGHLTGDLVLQEFARLLLESTRHIDTVARYGGEEFVLVLSATDLEGARAFTEKVRAATQARIFSQAEDEMERQGPQHITVSGGCVVLAECQREADIELLQRGLLHSADELLYQAKQSGRNRVVVEQKTEQELLCQGRGGMAES